jgi:hypothetical protein
MGEELYLFLNMDWNICQNAYYQDLINITWN